MSDKVEIKNIDTNLMSGSGDKVRNVIGGYWTISDSTEHGSALVFSEAPEDDGSTWVDAIHAADISVAPASAYVTASATSIIPNYKFPVRILGDPDLIKDDAEWKAILKGGTWGTASYEGFLSEGTFDCHNFVINTPYSLLDAKNIDSASYGTYPYYEVRCNYQEYYPAYEDKMASRSSDLLIPNLYLLEMFRQSATLSPGEMWHSDPDFAVDEEIGRFVSMEATHNPTLILRDTTTLYPPPYVETESDPTIAEGMYNDKTKNLRDYLTGTLVNETLSASTAQFIVNRTLNLLFDRTTMDKYSPALLQDQVLPRLPYYVSFDVPTDAHRSALVAQMEVANYDKLFLSTLRQQFTGHQVGTVNYPTIAATTFDTAESGSVVSKTVTTNTSYRSADFLRMLLNSLNLSVTDTPADQYFMQPLTAEIKALRNAYGSYRYTHSLPTFDMLNTVIEQMYIMPLDCVSDGSTGNMFDFLQMADEAGEGDTLAFRINKVGTFPTAPTETQTTVQDTFFLNTSALGTSLNYYDSQVRYGATYNYEIFAYVLVKGYNYKYSDLRATRLIGTPFGFTAIEGLGGAALAPTSLPDSYCLEFYNLSTGQTAEQLLVSAEENELMAQNEYATNAQVLSEDRYMAEFNLSLEPSWKIMEVSLGTKQITILDHMPSAVDITPYQRMDDSQIIGFYANQEGGRDSKDTSPAPFPTLMTSDEQTYKDNYLRSYNLLDGERIKESSVSRANFLEVYRLDTKPTAISDFAGALVESKDLTLSGYKYTKTNCFYEEMVATNKKYYYLFRFVNEHGIPGFLSPIYVAELVNDGGYKYAKFDVMYETEFDEQNDLEVFQPMKKLLRIIPNAQHVLMDDTNVDYSESAESQLDNLGVGTGVEKTIWDQPFKIRLTSRKTGKKIDLNITYRIREEVIK